MPQITFPDTNLFNKTRNQYVFTFEQQTIFFVLFSKYHRNNSQDNCTADRFQQKRINCDLSQS